MDTQARYMDHGRANSPCYMVIQTRRNLGYKRYFGPFPMWKGMAPHARAMILRPFVGPEFVIEVVRWSSATEYQRQNSERG